MHRANISDWILVSSLRENDSLDQSLSELTIWRRRVLEDHGSLAYLAASSSSLSRLNWDLLRAKLVNSCK